VEHRVADPRILRLILISGAMPNPGLCRIEYEASSFGAELAYWDDQADSA